VDLISILVIGIVGLLVHGGIQQRKFEESIRRIKQSKEKEHMEYLKLLTKHKELIDKYNELINNPAR